MRMPKYQRAVIVQKVTPYLWELSCSPDWDELIRTMWQAASAAHHHLVMLEELRAVRGGIRSAMLEHLIAGAEREWLAVEAYARPLVEALAQ